MSKPQHEDRPIRQIATWVPADVKDKVAALAAQEKKPERVVVTEALEAHIAKKNGKA